MEEPEADEPKPLSVQFDPDTRARMKMIKAKVGFSESHLANLCAEAVFDMVWKGDAIGTPQIVKLLRVALEDEIRNHRIGSWEEARSRVFELAESEDVSPKLRSALREYDKVIQAEKRSVSYSKVGATKRRRGKQK